MAAGLAWLADARALRLKGVANFVLLELEDSAGCNSQSGAVRGIACPLGAHYLPVPSDDAPEVQNLLEELGLRQRVANRWQTIERHLCHSPQQRLFLNGAWQDGLLPAPTPAVSSQIGLQRILHLHGQLQKPQRLAFAHSDWVGYSVFEEAFTLGHRAGSS